MQRATGLDSKRRPEGGDSDATVAHAPSARLNSDASHSANVIISTSITTSAPPASASAAVTAVAAVVKLTTKRAGTARAKAGARGSKNSAFASFGLEAVGPIAAGAFSTILRATSVSTGEAFAVKTFESAKCVKPAQVEERDRELRVLRLVSAAGHAHIANLMSEHSTPAGTHACLHYCGGGSLQSHLNKLRRRQMAMGEIEAAVACAQVSSALAHIHGLDVAHRDVKPANILHDGRCWRLCDFGFAIESPDGERLSQKLGTLAYCAPEMLLFPSTPATVAPASAGGGVAPGLAGRAGYLGKPLDMWAFGCTLYEMRVGRPCFVAESEESTILRIKNGFKGGSIGQPWLPHMKRERALISALLCKPPEERLTAAQVLKHRWIKQHCSPQDRTGEMDAAALRASKPQWWCDVAGERCVRPSQPTHEGQYSEADMYYAHPNGQYMVCTHCFQSGRAADSELLCLRLPAAACMAMPEARVDADNDDDDDESEVEEGNDNAATSAMEADYAVSGHAAADVAAEEAVADRNDASRQLNARGGANMEPVAAASASDSSNKAEIEGSEPHAHFLPSSVFDGARPGYVFTTRDEGVGYYWDFPASTKPKRPKQREQRANVVIVAPFKADEHDKALAQVHGHAAV